MAQRSRHRSYCFTDFSIEVHPKEKIGKLIDKVKYYIIGKETCPTTGKQHWQGFVSFNNAIEFSSLKKILPGAHIEAAKGTDFDNKKYCGKDSDFVEFGEVPEMGARNDLKDIKKKIIDGKSVTEVVLEDCENYQQIRFAEKIFEYKQKTVKRDWKPHVTWVYGPSGSGKTKLAFEKFKDTKYFVSGENITFFWDGYDGEENVIFDDFRSAHMSLTNLLRVLDRTEFRVNIKGGFRMLAARNIIITSIHPPSSFYRIDDEPVQQLLRRIDEIINLGGTGTEVGGNTNPARVPPHAKLKGNFDDE